MFPFPFKKRDLGFLDEVHQFRMEWSLNDRDPRGREVTKAFHPCFFHTHKIEETYHLAPLPGDVIVVLKDYINRVSVSYWSLDLRAWLWV